MYKTKIDNNITDNPEVKQAANHLDVKEQGEPVIKQQKAGGPPLLVLPDEVLPEFHDFLRGACTIFQLCFQNALQNKKMWYVSDPLLSKSVFSISNRIYGRHASQHGFLGAHHMAVAFEIFGKCLKSKENIYKSSNSLVPSEGEQLRELFWCSFMLALKYLECEAIYNSHAAFLFDSKNYKIDIPRLNKIELLVLKELGYNVSPHLDTVAQYYQTLTGQPLSVTHPVSPEPGQADDAEPPLKKIRLS